MSEDTCVRLQLEACSTVGAALWACVLHTRGSDGLITLRVVCEGIQGKDLWTVAKSHSFIVSSGGSGVALLSELAMRFVVVYTVRLSSVLRDSLLCFRKQSRETTQRCRPEGRVAHPSLPA